MNSSDLLGRVILVVEDEPLIALHLKATLAAAGAKVICANMQDADKVAERSDISAAVLDARPGSSAHRAVARRLKQRGLPFLFYATHAPEDVTTVRAAPTVLKPGRPELVVAAVARLCGQVPTPTGKTG